jgi:hypothetical protein
LTDKGALEEMTKVNTGKWVRIWIHTHTNPYDLVARKNIVFTCEIRKVIDGNQMYKTCEIRKVYDVNQMYKKVTNKNNLVQRVLSKDSLSIGQVKALSALSVGIVIIELFIYLFIY